MKVTISCSGSVSRGLHLASYFDARGVLDNLFVPFYGPKHPWLAHRLRGSSESQVVTPLRVRTDLLAAGLRKAAVVATGGGRLSKDHLFWQDVFDRRTARRLRRGADVVLAESMVALRTLARARETGALGVLDRTNTHIVHQQRVIAEEYELAGLGRFEMHTRASLDRALAEYEAADYICTLSSFARRTFVEQGVPEERLLMVPSATDLELFQPVGKDDEVFRVVFCGIAGIKKGVHHLLEAFSDLGLPGAELWLVGGVDPLFRPFLDRHSGTYQLKGFVPHRALPGVLSQASVFVLPSIEEGLAKVVMEAMACGVPVIATENTGAEDVVRDGVDGYIVKARDVTALKDRILRLHDDPELRAEMGRNARQRVAEGFTWDDYGARMLATLERALAARAS